MVQFIAWMYDIARDQSPSLELLEELCDRSQRAGYNAIGLYLEHRFAYPSAPWATAEGCVTPEMIRRITANHREIRIIPFLNVLGHMEGFIRSEGGRQFSEQQCSHQEQICPSNPAAISMVQGLVQDALDTFDDEWVHLGGDETWQLGACPVCKDRASVIGKAGLFGEHFRPLCQMVLDAGKRPAIWGDMLIQHPEALDYLPKETILFDWHYETSPDESTSRFISKGFDVVCCPTIKMFDANWSALDLSFKNIDDHVQAAQSTGALGVCATTWEANYFSIFRSYIPLIMATGRHISKGETWDEALSHEATTEQVAAMKILGREIPSVSSFLAQDRGATIRAFLVHRLNPFYLWLKWRDEAVGCVGDLVIDLCNKGISMLDAQDPLVGMFRLHEVGVKWVRAVERAYQSYRQREFIDCICALEEGKQALSLLKPHLDESATNGGALADLYRLNKLERVIDEVTWKICTVQNIHVGDYLPAFEIVIDGGYVPGDTAAWRTGAWR